MDHYQELFSPECSKCHRPILDNLISAMGRSFHAECFVCFSCSRPVLENFHEHEGNPYCQDCYLKCIAPKCLSCKKPILSNYIAALEGYWHPECFVCQEKGCGPFEQGSFFELDGMPFCEKHFLARKGEFNNKKLKKKTYKTAPETIVSRRRLCSVQSANQRQVCIRNGTALSPATFFVYSLSKYFNTG